MHIEPDALARSLDRLRAAEDHQEDVASSLHAVLDAVTGLFGLTGAGLMLVDEGQVMRYVMASDEGGKVLETLQEELGEGPCVDAFVHDEVVHTPDVVGDDRWPSLGPALEPHAVRAVLGVPVHLGGGAVGSLNVYVDRPYEWDASDQGAMEGFVRILEAVLAGAIHAGRHEDLVVQLQTALDTRVVIERAVGLLMGRHDLDAVAAFDRLRQLARSQRRKAHEVAGDLLTGKVTGEEQR